MSYFRPLLQDVYGEVLATSAVPEKFEIEGGINALVLAPIDAQTKHFMTMVYGTDDPPTPRSVRSDRYASSCHLAAPRPGKPLRPLEGRDSNGKMLEVHDRHGQAEEAHCGCSGPECPRYVEAATISSLVRSRIGRGTPFRVPEVITLTEGHTPSWEEESIPLTQAMFGYKVIFNVPVTVSAIEVFDFGHMIRTSVVCPYDRASLCLVCNNLTTWVPAARQRTIQGQRFPDAAQITAGLGSFAKHATGRRNMSAHEKNLRSNMNGPLQSQCYPLCFIDLKVDPKEVITDDSPRKISAYDLLHPTGKLPAIYEEFGAFVRTTYGPAIRNKRPLYGVFVHPRMDRIVVWARMRKCPFPSFLAECTAPREFRELSNILSRIRSRRRSRPWPLPARPRVGQELEAPGPATTPVSSAPAAEESQASEQPQSVRSTSSPTMVIPPPPPPPMPMELDAPVPSRSSPATVVARTPSAAMRSPFEPMPVPRTSYSSHEAWLYEEPAQPARTEEEPLFYYGGAYITYSEYAELQLPLRRSDGIPILERPLGSSSAGSWPSPPGSVPSRVAGPMISAPPRPDYPPPIIDYDRHYSFQVTPGFFPVYRPFGPPSVHSLQRIQEDIEDEQYMWSYAPDAEDVVTEVEREREDQRFMAPNSDEGRFFVTYPMSAQWAITTALQDVPVDAHSEASAPGRTSPVATPDYDVVGPEFTTAPCTWYDLLALNMERPDFSWLDCVSVSPPREGDEVTWQQEEVNSWLHYWDVNRSSVSAACFKEVVDSTRYICGFAVAGFCPGPDELSAHALDGRVLIMSGLAAGKENDEYNSYVPIAPEVWRWCSQAGAKIQCVFSHTDKQKYDDNIARSVMRNECNLVFCCEEHCQEAVYLLNRAGYYRPLMHLDRQVYVFRSRKAWKADSLGPDLRWSGLTAEELKALALLAVESTSPTAIARNLPARVYARRPYEVRYFGRSSPTEVARSRHRNEFPVYYHNAIRSGRISYDHLVRDLSLFYEELARFRSRRAMPADVEEVTD